MWLFYAVDGRLGDAHAVGELDLSEFGRLAERGESHGVSAVGFGHVGAVLGGFGGDIVPLGQLVGAVTAADELNFLAHSLSLPVCRPGRFRRRSVSEGVRLGRK